MFPLYIKGPLKMEASMRSERYLLMALDYLQNVLVRTITRGILKGDYFSRSIESETSQLNNKLG